MLRILFFVFTFCMIGLSAYTQKPKDGTYTYEIAFEEWTGASLGATCTVIIKGDSIQVIHNGKGN